MNSGSTLEYALLGLLRQCPQSGYDLRKIFGNTPMRHFSDSPGSIYPALRRLESRGWVAGKADDGHNARKREVFRVSAAGRSALLEWLKKLISREDVIHNIDELMLRFAFLGENVEGDATLEFMAQLEAALDGYVKELRQHYKYVGSAIGSVTGRLAFESGICRYEASLEWSRRARQEIERQL